MIYYEVIVCHVNVAVFVYVSHAPEGFPLLIGHVDVVRDCVVSDCVVSDCGIAGTPEVDATGVIEDGVVSDVRVLVIPCIQAKLVGVYGVSSNQSAVVAF